MPRDPPQSFAVGLERLLRPQHAALWLDQQGLDTAGSNGLPLFDVMEMMAFHVHQTRRDRILRGQAAVRGLVRFGRPPIPTTKMMRAKQELAAGKGVRQVAGWLVSRRRR